MLPIICVPIRLISDHSSVTGPAIRYGQSFLQYVYELDRVPKYRRLIVLFGTSFGLASMPLIYDILGIY